MCKYTEKVSREIKSSIQNSDKIFVKSSGSSIFFTKLSESEYRNSTSSTKRTSDIYTEKNMRRIK